MPSVGHQFVFYDAIYHICGLVILTLDGVTSFSKLMDVQNICKTVHFSPNKTAESLWTLNFNLFVCYN